MQRVVHIIGVGFPGGANGKNLGDVRDAGSIPGSGRSPGGGHGNPLSILAWRLPRTEEPDVLLSIGSQSRTPLSNLLQCENRDKGSVLKSSFLVP